MSAGPAVSWADSGSVGIQAEPSFPRIKREPQRASSRRYDGALHVDAAGAIAFTGQEQNGVPGSLRVTGSYDSALDEIHWADGDVFRRAGRLQAGAAVVARFRGGAKTYPGVIERANADGSYDVIYDDGDREASVPADFVEPVDAAQNVDAVNADGSYAVDAAQNADGSYAVDTTTAPARPATAASRPGTAGSRPGTPKEPLDASDTPLTPGTIVEARFRGRGKIFKGKILNAQGDGRYEVMYDDGDVDENLPRCQIRPLAPPATPEEPAVTAPEDAAFTTMPEDAFVAAPEDADIPAPVATAVVAEPAAVASPLALSSKAALASSGTAPTTPVASPTRQRPVAVLTVASTPGAGAAPRPTESSETDSLRVMRPPGAKGGGGAAGCAFVGGGSVVVAAHRSRACVWHARTGQHLGDVAGHAGRVLDLAVCQFEESAVVATGGSDGAACVWRLDVKSHDAADDVAVAAAWTNAIKHCAAVGMPARRPQTVRLGGADDAAADKTVVARTPAATHRHPRGAWVLGIDVSAPRGPGGALVATAATDGIVRVWDAFGKGAPLRTLEGHGWYRGNVEISLISSYARPEPRL